MGVNRRTPQMQEALADAREAAGRRAHWEAIVGRWNAAPTHDWSPSIGTVPDRRLSLAGGVLPRLRSGEAGRPCGHHSPAGLADQSHAATAMPAMPRM